MNTPRIGSHAKNDRIERLEPDFRRGHFRLPALIHNPDKGGRCTWTVWDENLDKNAENQGKKRHPIGMILYSFVGDRLTRQQEHYGRTAQRHRIVQPVKRDENKDVYNLTRVFIDEFLRHPFSPHDDLLDAVARIYDIDPRIPENFEEQSIMGLPEDGEDSDIYFEPGPWQRWATSRD